MDYAIVIGIDHYEKRPLTGAVADAKSFAQWLTDNKLIQQPDDNLKLIISDKDNRITSGLEVDEAVADICKLARNNADPKNRLYFYFSGHGIGQTYDNTALCMRQWPKLLNYCLSGYMYKQGIINSGAFDEILIFLDCCREIDILVESRQPGFDWKTMIPGRTPRIMICNSTAYGKLSYEVNIEPDQKRGAFTSFLIEALNGDADANNTGVITGQSLREHVANNFKTYAQRFNKIQDAKVDFQDMGDSIVICQTQKAAPSHNFIITFNRTSNVTLYAPTTEELKTADVNLGTTWEINLEKGNYLLKDNNTGELKYFQNFNTNTVSHEQF